MHLFRLSGRKVCERVKTKGYLWKGKHIYVRWLRGLPRGLPPAAPAGLYVGAVTSAKLDKSAVRRNRMRRRCREALRVLLLENNSSRSAGLGLRQAQTALSLSKGAGPTAGGLRIGKGESARGKPQVCLLASFQLLLLPRSSSLSADFRELIVDCDHFLTSLHVSH
jgi:RNase P protein component